VIPTSSRLRVVIVALGLVLFLQQALAFQKGGTGGNVGKTSTGIPQPRTPQADTISQPTFISGKVLLEGGGPPPEPVVIERICNGTARREGYTDTKGHFQIQLGQNVGFQDASESDSSLFPNDRQSNSRTNPDLRRLQLQGCEFRAVLAGFQSSTVMLKPNDNFWQIDVGTIFLKRMDNVSGTTVSVTSVGAPGEARRAFEKGQKAFSEQKLPEAEKELSKAVKVYPNFAAAWSLLGNIHQQQEQFDQAGKDYEQAAAADPQYVNPKFGMALLAVQQKKWAEAAQFTDQVAKMNSAAYPATYFYNAVANFNLGRLDLAENSARKYKTLDLQHHHPDICLLLSNILAQKQDYAGAAQEMRDFLTINPTAQNAEEVKANLKKFEELSLAKKQ
jgi:tetratricopeptide (TPR) repeat protein